MDARDLENVRFLLNASEEVLRDWYKNTTTDDHEYAAEILKQYSDELSLKSALLNMSDSVPTLNDANEHLANYRL